MHNYFNFKPFGKQHILITNDFGCYAFLTKQEFLAFLTNKSTLPDDVKKKLRRDYFIIDPMDVLSSDPINDLRSMKRFISMISGRTMGFIPESMPLAL